LAAVVIGINMYFVVYYVGALLPGGGWVWVGMGIFGVIYLAFCAYLTAHTLVSMGVTWFDRYSVSIVKAPYEPL
jgi:hypothetical protein